MNRADPVALKKAGNAAFGKGRYAEAVEHYTAAIDLWMEPADRAVLYSNRSAAKLKLPGERQKALNDATRACELAPEYAKAHFRRGQALRALGNPVAAIAAMEKVLAIAPADAAATAELAELTGALNAPSKPNLSGSLQSGTHVPSTYKSLSGALPKPFALPHEDSPYVKSVQRVPGAVDTELGREKLVTEADFNHISGDASKFFTYTDNLKDGHEAKAAASRPPRKKEMFPGCPWPDGYGPDEPGWDPTYEPSCTFQEVLKANAPSAQNTC